ncbi:hypothetical protein T4A_526, partial [Trichinella pseudospiralis]
LARNISSSSCNKLQIDACWFHSFMPHLLGHETYQAAC